MCCWAKRRLKANRRPGTSSPRCSCSGFSRQWRGHIWFFSSPWIFLCWTSFPGVSKGKWNSGALSRGVLLHKPVWWFHQGWVSCLDILHHPVPGLWQKTSDHIFTPSLSISLFDEPGTRGVCSTVNISTWAPGTALSALLTQDMITNVNKTLVRSVAC